MFMRKWSVAGAKLGGEQSGHILCHHYSLTGDGILTALHLSSLVQTTGCSLAALVDQSFQTYPQLLQNVRVNDRERRLHWQECRPPPVQQAIHEAEQAMGGEGRVLVRPSGTEPVIRGDGRSHRQAHGGALDPVHLGCGVSAPGGLAADVPPPFISGRLRKFWIPFMPRKFPGNP